MHIVQLTPATPSSPASFTSRLVSPFWCRLAQVVLEKRQLNGGVCLSRSGQEPFGMLYRFYGLCALHATKPLKEETQH